MKTIIDRNHKDFEKVLDKFIQHMKNNGVKIDNVDNFKKDVKQLILHEDKTLEIVGTGN